MDPLKVVVTEDQLRIAREEARRIVAIGIMAGVTYEEIESEALFSLASHPDLEGGFLRTCIRRDITDFLKSEKRRRAALPACDLESIPDTTHREPWLDWNVLDKREAAALYLTHISGYSQEEVGRVLNVSQQFVCALITRARKKLGERPTASGGSERKAS